METSELKLSAPLREVQNYWNEYINDIEVAKNKIGTKEFFDELEAYRYNKLSYLPKVVPFSEYQRKKVLEIGCGVGIDALQFARAGAEITGIDLTPNAIKLAKLNLQLHGYQGSFFNVNAESMIFPDNHFDVVYSHGVLHHTPTPQNAVNEVFRVLKPGGEAIIMLYKKYSWMHLLTYIKGVYVEHEKKEAPVIIFYTCEDVRKLFRNFKSLRLLIERLPVETPKYSGMKSSLYNRALVPVFKLTPEFLVQHLGAHIMIWAYKP